MKLISLEIAVLLLGLGLLLLDLWTPSKRKPLLGYVAAVGLFGIFLCSFSFEVTGYNDAFFGNYVLDPMAMFFKRLFLLAGVFVVIISIEFSDRIERGISEYYSITVFALCGMMFAASAGGFTTVFVSIELITVSFYILTSFTRSKLVSLEAGVKYLIMGALASAFMVYGIALVYGSTGSMSFASLSESSGLLLEKPMFLLGLVLVLFGIGFKVAAFPMQMWAPDVYQGAPTPTAAFLAIGSKAAGIAVLLRLLFVAIPDVTAQWPKLLIVLSAITILYGNLCALPQRNLKRLLGYSSIAHGGYLLLGIAAMAGNVTQLQAGGGAILYYLLGYLFTVVGAFAVLTISLSSIENDDVTSLAGLHQRSPLLASTMTLAMVSLAGVPPLAGFFGKFLLLRAAVEQGEFNSAYYWLIGIALAGVVMSLYYYFGVIKAIYWTKGTGDESPIELSGPFKTLLCVCVAGMLYLGIFPGQMTTVANRAIDALTSERVLEPEPPEQGVVAELSR